ncbi:MAG: hypothetical protein IJE90_04555 [Clostridia bacterium]|nr:hypothetical protein [Clostridia bacterium]
MGAIGTIIAVTAIAGVAGTGLGGAVGAMLQKNSNRVISLLLSFAGGGMAAFDRCHSFRSLHLPLAALPSLPFDSRLRKLHT